METATATKSALDWQAECISKTGRTLAHFARTTDPSKLDWVPQADGNSKCRSVLAQLNECIGVNQLFAAVLRGETPPQRDPDAGFRFGSPDEAYEMLIASADSLAEAVRNVGDEVFEKRYQMSWGEIPGKVMIDLPLANMHYHAGQINYIQLFYGDEEFRVPPGFMD